MSPWQSHLGRGNLNQRQSLSHQSMHVCEAFSWLLWYYRAQSTLGSTGPAQVALGYIRKLTGRKPGEKAASQWHPSLRSCFSSWQATALTLFSGEVLPGSRRWDKLFPPQVVLFVGFHYDSNRKQTTTVCVPQNSCLNPNSDDDGIKKHIWYQVNSGGWTPLKWN